MKSNIPTQDVLEEIQNNIKTLRTNIENIYNDNLLRILNDKGLLSKLNNNYLTYINDIKVNFDKTYEKLNTLSELVHNRIIPNYEDMNIQVINTFNKELKDQIMVLLDTNK